MKPNSQQEIVEGIASVIPILFLAGLIGVVVMAVRKIKNTMESIVRDAGVFKDGKGKITVVDMPWTKPQKPKPTFDEVMKHLVGYWQFWVMLVLIIVGTVLFLVSSNDSSQVIDGTSPSVVEQKQLQSESAPPQDNVTFSGTIADAMSTSFNGLVKWLDLIILLMVAGFVVGVFVKLSKSFR
jgi:hypothetical protein